MEPVAALDKIEYMEKPKLLFSRWTMEKRASCITQLRGEEPACQVPVSLWRLLIPKHRLRASGFRRSGRYDPHCQSLGSDDPGVRGLSAPAGCFLGTEYDGARINEALAQPTEQQRYAVCPSRDASGHRTWRGTARQQRKRHRRKIPRFGV